MTITSVEALIEAHEGRRNRMYLDSVGIPTIGVGHNLQQPISDSAIDGIFQDDLDAVYRDCRAVFGACWPGLSLVRQAVLLDMMFNLGPVRLGKFVHMIAALEAEDFARAAQEMRDSEWARQVGTRAEEDARMMETDQWPTRHIPVIARPKGERNAQ